MSVKKGKKFTEEDVDFLRKWYPTKGAKYCAEKLGRSERGIIAKASKSGIKTDHISVWTDKEIVFLKKWYPTKGNKYCAEKLKKSEGSIQGKVHSLKIKCDKKEMLKYTKKDIFFVKKFYPIKGYKYCAKNLNRCLETIRKIVKQYNIKRKQVKVIRKYDWLIEEENFLKKNLHNKGLEFCSKKLEKSMGAVRRKAERMSLKIELQRERIDFTKEEIIFLKQYYPIYGRLYCSEKLNKPKEHISYKCVQLNIKKLEIDYFSYEEAKHYLKTLNINSSFKWNLYIKNNEISSRMPKVPHKFYDKFSWTVFLDKNKKIYKGEEKIRNFLDKNNILYEEQKTFPTCKHKNKLSFDFYIENFNLLVEYDGEHHFNPIKNFGGINEFKNQQKRDKIKNMWAKKNKITLLRIPYHKYNDMEKILEEYVKPK